MASLQRTAESEPLLRGKTLVVSVTQIVDQEREDLSPIDRRDGNDGETFDNVPKEKRQLGLLSTTALIFNLIIGAGIYSTPSIILRSSGSVGLALVMWLTGATIAALGTVVYIEMGTGLPRSGGEKNYLEFIYLNPKYLASCVFAVYNLSTRTSATTSIVFGEYVAHAIGLKPSYITTRLVAVSGLTFVTVLHGTNVLWGIRLQNALGAFKLLVICTISLLGMLSLVGVRGLQVKEGYEKPQNLGWDRLWEGSNLDCHEFITGLYTVVWSYYGYSVGNNALSEVKNPIRTVKYASALALSMATALYLSVNLAYFAVISKNDILHSKTIVVSLFFRNLFGVATERLMSAVVALSVFATILSSKFSQGRVLQELGREGILPFSEIIASNEPFNAPLAALCVQYLVSCTILLLIPSGDAYLFLVTYGSYCASLVNTLVALGVIVLHLSRLRRRRWNPPFRAPNLVVFAYLISNIFLIVFPFIPPKDGKRMYKHLPYWSHSVTAFAISLVGYAYWYWFVVWHPRRNGYILERKWVLQNDGVSRYAFRKVPMRQSEEDSE